MGCRAPPGEYWPSLRSQRSDDTAVRHGARKSAPSKVIWFADDELQVLDGPAVTGRDPGPIVGKVTGGVPANAVRWRGVPLQLVWMEGGVIAQVPHDMPAFRTSSILAANQMSSSVGSECPLIVRKALLPL